MRLSARSSCVLVLAAQALAVLGMASTVPAAQTLLYNGFGSADGFMPGHAATFGVLTGRGANLDRDLAVAFAVPPTRDHYLDAIDLALTSAAGGRRVEVRILGSTPGPTAVPNEAHVLERTVITVPVRADRAGPPGTEAIVRIPLSRGPTLRAGRSYWLTVSASPSHAPATLEWWQAAVQPSRAPAGLAARRNLGSWVRAQGAGPAVRLTGTPVQEPGPRAYTFTKIADTAGAFRDFPRPARLSLNNAGTVAFLAELDTGRAGIFTGTATTLTSIVEGGGAGDFAAVGASPSLNAGGLVAWRGTLTQGTEGIFLRAGRSWRPLVDTRGPFHRFGPAAINQAGAVAFFAGLAGQGGGVFTTRGTAVETVAHTSGPFAGFVGRPSINDKGTVAFSARLDSGQVGIYAKRGAALTTIAEMPDARTLPGRLSLNDRGTVAFVACLEPPAGDCSFSSRKPQGLYAGNGGPLVKIAGSDGPFEAFGRPVLNNAGQVAFVARLDSGHRGIFTGPDLVEDRVLRTGDPLLGTPVTDLGFVDGIDLNDAGAIAFFASLEDGTEGIYLATPIDPS